MASYAKIEPISGIMRIYKEKRDDSVHNTGIPYSFSVTIRWVNTTTIEIMGLSNKLTPSLWKAIRKECVYWGAKKVIYSRYKDGKSVTKTINFFNEVQQDR